MSRKRDATWKRYQSWRRLLKQPAPKAILRRGDGRSFDTEIDQACKAFELDAAKPKDLALLLGVFANIFFHKSSDFALTGEPGAPRQKKWSDQNIGKLVRHAGRVTKALHPKRISSKQLAEHLQETWPDLYGEFVVNSLARTLRKHFRK